MVAKVISDYNDERRVIAPFAAADSSLIVDIDFRDGETAVTAELLAAGFTLSGSGHLWDSELGFNPNQISGFSADNWTPPGFASRVAAFATEEATVYVEVHRSALSCTWMDDSAFFIDSEIGPSADCWNGSAVVPANHLYGDYTLATKVGYAFRCIPAAGASVIGPHYQCANVAGNPAARVYLSMNDGVTNGLITTRIVGRAPAVDAYDDFVEIAYSFKGDVLKVFIDGRLRRQFKMASSFTAQDLFYRTAIGSQYTTTYALNGYIRRFQISNSACDIKWEGPRIAFIGDSFTQRGINAATPNDPDVTTATVAQIDGVQNALYKSTLDEADSVNLNSIISTTWRPWIHELQGMAANYALFFPAYVAGAAGKGWAETGDPIPVAFRDAVIAYDPEIVVATGSTNDIDGVVVETYLADTKAKIDYIISNCKNLRKFYFFETWPAYKGKTNHSAQNYIDEYHRQRGLQATLNGYTVANASGADVIVEFVTTYEKIGGDNYPANFNIGGSQYAPLFDALYTKAITMSDLHPSLYGHELMAPVYWDALKDDFLHAVT